MKKGGYAAMSSKNWLQKLVRGVSKNPMPREERECFICGEIGNTQTHHIDKVADIVSIIHRFPLMAVAVELMQVPLPTVETCEEDHHIVHEAYGDRDISCSISKQKADRIRDMMDIAEANKILDDSEWAADYNQMVDRRAKTVERNLQYMTIQEEEVEL